MSSFFQAVERAKTLKLTDPKAPEAWLDTLSFWHIDESEYREWCFELRATLTAQELWRASGWVDEYLGRTESAAQNYEKADAFFDLARIHGQQKEHAKAGALFDTQLNFRFHAARHALLAGEHGDAAQHLLAWIKHEGKKASRYFRGLAFINLGEIHLERKDRPKGMRYLAEANQLLEEQANLEEKKGQRKEAYRCYQAILHLGVVAQSYEALMEGGLNCVRLSKENNERFTVMRQYYDLIRHSEALEEWHAAAELYQEAGDYATRVSFIYGGWFWVEAGKAWLRVAQNHLERGAPIELAENALVSSGNCFNHTGHLEGLLSAYGTLASLELPSKSQEKYQRIMAYLHEDSNADEIKPPAFPDHFKQPQQVGEFWWHHLLQLDLAQNATDILAELLAETGQAWQVQRRRAMVFLIRHQRHEKAAQNISLDLLYLLVQINHPLAFTPIQYFWDHGDIETKISLLSESARHFKFPQLLDLTVKGLNERQPALREAAIKSIGAIHFPQALDGLVELANNQVNLDIKKACYLSMAKIGTDAATEFLLDIMRTQTGEIADFVFQTLMENPQERMLSALDRNLKVDPNPTVRKQIGELAENIRQSRGQP